MTRIHRNALVPYSPAAMFGLVADVESYPSFLPWCRSVTVHRKEDNEVEASIELARGPVRKSFTTRNQLEPDRAIVMHLVRGPFRRLEGAWRFQQLGGIGCKVSLELHFEFSNALLQRTVGPVFNDITNTLVDAFVRRAAAVYGRGHTV